MNKSILLIIFICSFKYLNMNKIINWQDINKNLIELKGLYFVYYLIYENQATGKEIVIYIGSSKNIYKRLKEHKHRHHFQTIRLIRFNNEYDCKQFERNEIFRLKPELNSFCKTSNPLVNALNKDKYSIKHLQQLNASILQR